MLTKMQLIISYCTFVKHGFKSKLKHTFIISIPGNLLLMNLNSSVVALYLSQRWAVVSTILYVIHCFLKAVPNSYWKKNKETCNRNLYNRNWTFLFLQRKETTFVMHIWTNCKDISKFLWDRKLLYPPNPIITKQFVFSTHHTQHQQDHYIRISNHLW